MGNHVSGDCGKMFTHQLYIMIQLLYMNVYYGLVSELQIKRNISTQNLESHFNSSVSFQMRLVTKQDVSINGMS